MKVSNAKGADFFCYKGNRFLNRPASTVRDELTRTKNKE